MNFLFVRLKHDVILSFKTFVMKKFFLRRFGIFIVAFSILCLVTLANVAPDTCSTQTIFWGTSCCTYAAYSETGATMLMTKCCEYRFWFVWRCETTYGGPI